MIAHFDKKTLIGLLMAIAFCGSAIYGQKSGHKLVFSDDFNGPRGSAVDPSKWTMVTGGSGWGNKEMEYYTDATENAYLDGKGSLVIKAIKQDLPDSFKCWYGPCKYTSARLTTKNKFDQRYGRFEARIKIPRGQGMWPAFWMLGTDHDKAGWPKSGEIDIMENIGREPSMIHGTVHGPGYSGSKGVGAPYSLPDGRIFADKFHVYWVVWSENKIDFYVDKDLYKTITPKDLPGQWVYDHPFYMILNLAVGGNWGGPPDDRTIFPGMMMVDYVRVYSY